jgi:hypothetical protein
MRIAYSPEREEINNKLLYYKIYDLRALKLP